MSGIFTCASSLVYSPRSFVKITDHSLHARRLIQKKAIHLYSDISNVLPCSVTLKKQEDEWDINYFKWCEPVGVPSATNAFLEFRKKRIDEILNFIIPKK